MSMITPETPPPIPITPSEHVQGWLDLSHQALTADGLALTTLAERLRVDAPEAPQLHLYGQDDWHDLNQVTERRAHPDGHTNDLHILLTERRLANDESALLQGTAAALLYRH